MRNNMGRQIKNEVQQAPRIFIATSRPSDKKPGKRFPLETLYVKLAYTYRYRMTRNAVTKLKDKRVSEVRSKVRKK